MPGVAWRTHFRSERGITLTENELRIAMPNGEVRDVVQLVDISDIWVWSIDELDSSSAQPDLHCESVLDLEDSADPSRDRKIDAVGLATGLTAGASIAQLEWKHAFSLHAAKFGRTYHLRAISYDESSEWISLLKTTRTRAVKAYRASLALTANQRFQIRVRRVCSHKIFQLVLAALLVLNFVVNVIEAEVWEQASASTMKSFDNADTAFTVVYAVELAFNMYGHWFYPFWSNRWNWLDFVVVLFSVFEVIAMKLQSLGHSIPSMDLHILKLLRIFRIIRVFNKLEAMQRIVTALACALDSVVNVFLIFWIILSIYAIIGEEWAGG